MIPVGRREIQTQQRVIVFFTDALGHRYLGNWRDRAGNSNVEEALLTDWLIRQSYSDKIIGKALFELDKAGGLGLRSQFFLFHFLPMYRMPSIP